MAGRLVLVVDDEPLIRMGLHDALMGEGFLVLEACNTSEGLQVLRTEPDIEIIITDVKMPGADGLELATAAFAERPGIRIIVISGHANVLDPRIPSGVLFMRKPFPLLRFAKWLRDSVEAEPPDPTAT